jgi:hypothetical protein
MAVETVWTMPASILAAVAALEQVLGRKHDVSLFREIVVIGLQLLSLSEG